MKKNNKNKFLIRGFSLIELLVALAIIGILSSVIYTNLGSAREKARITRAKGEIKRIYSAVVMLEGDTEQWPGHKTLYAIESGGGNELCGEPGCTYSLSDDEAGIIATDGNYPGWGGPYMISLPIDPWGHEYFFDTDYEVLYDGVTSTVVAIGSFGPNGVGLNLYDSDDIIYILYLE